MPLHSFFFWLSTDTHIRSLVDCQILYWIIIRQCPSYSIILITSLLFMSLYSTTSFPADRLHNYRANFNCATWSSFPVHISDNELSLCQTFIIISFCLHNMNLTPSALIILLIDFIFFKPLDKCVVITANILVSSEMSIEFMARNTILAPR